MCGLGSDQKQFKSTAACASPVVKRLEFLPSPVSSEEAASCEKDVKKPETEQQKEAELPATPEVCMGKKERDWKTKPKKKKDLTLTCLLCNLVFFFIYYHFKSSFKTVCQGMTLEDGFCAKSCSHQRVLPPKELPRVCL